MNPYEVEAKLYMLDAAERNPTLRVQVDEISGNLVRMLEGVRGGIQPQLSSNRRRPIETGVSHDHGMESAIVRRDFDGSRVVVVGR